MHLSRRKLNGRFSKLGNWYRRGWGGFSNILKKINYFFFFSPLITPEPIEREIKKLDKELQRRLGKRLEKLKTAPDVYGKPLRWPLAGTWEIYFENKFRVLYEIDFNNKTVTLT